VNHFDIEIESLAGERVIEVQKYCMVFDLFYNYYEDHRTRYGAASERG
jgi:hypothetical protein